MKKEYLTCAKHQKLRFKNENEEDCSYGGIGMSLENVFPFLREERERNEKRRLKFLKDLLEVMERDEE